MTAPAAADFAAWTKEYPKGRDASGWWNFCDCRQWVWFAWVASAHKANKREHRDGPAHRCAA